MQSSVSPRALEQSSSPRGLHSADPLRVPIDVSGARSPRGARAAPDWNGYERSRDADRHEARRTTRRRGSGRARGHAGARRRRGDAGRPRGHAHARRVCQRRPPAHRVERAPRPPLDPLPAQPRAGHAPSRAAAHQPHPRGRRPALRAGHGQAILLRPRLPHRLDPGDARPGERLPPQRPAMGARREPRMGQRAPGHASPDRARLDALAGPPAQHPRRALPRDRHRRLARARRAAATAAPPTPRSSASAFARVRRR